MTATTKRLEEIPCPAPLDVDPFFLVNHDCSQKPINQHKDVSPSTTPISSANANVEFAREFDHDFYRPLYHAALKGDWKSAELFFKDQPNAATGRVSLCCRTALHVATLEGHSEFVEKLVEVMPAETIALHDMMGYTALHYAAMDGNARSVKAIVRRNRAITQSVDRKGRTALLCAVQNAIGREEMSHQRKFEVEEVIWFLSLVTTDDQPGRPFSGPHGCWLLFGLCYTGLCDIYSNLLKLHPNLVAIRIKERTTLDALLATKPSNFHGKNMFGFLKNSTLNEGFPPLNALATRPSEFLSGQEFGFWQRLIYSFVPSQLNCVTPPHSMTFDIESLVQNSIDMVQLPTRSNIPNRTRVIFWIRRMVWRAIVCKVPLIKEVRDAKLRHQRAVELVTKFCIQLSHNNYQELVEVYNLPEIMLNATTCGIVEIVKIFLQFFPDLIWIPENGVFLMQVAVEQRQEKIFTLMNNRDVMRNRMLAELVHQSRNHSLLHLVAKLAPSVQLTSASSSAFQIIKELQWFKEVEKLVHPIYRNERNENGKTAWEVFLEEHKDLMEKGERWIKESSNTGMVVSTIIPTIVFAIAFTVPGGNNNNNGGNITFTKDSRALFAICNALALFSSVTSILTFLSILTSHYTAEDFLSSLPRKFTIGFTSLFLAIATMMIAFAATFSVVFNDIGKWVYIPVGLLASFPVVMFLKMQFHLFMKMIRWNFGSTIYLHQRIW